MKANIAAKRQRYKEQPTVWHARSAHQSHSQDPEDRSIAASCEKYGIEPSDYHEMLTEQGGKCAICKKPPTAKKRLVIDHCHITERVRGLLCCQCNFALGNMLDNVNSFKEAIVYLKENGK